MSGLALVLMLLARPAMKPTASPNCSSWPINMSITHLKNASLIDPALIDRGRTKAVLLASQKVGKDLFRQIYDITFYAKSGEKTEVVTNSEASSQECSMSGVDVYVVSSKIGGP